MSKEHAYAYEAGYRDGSINYELEHCPACKNVADLQEALAENAKLRERITTQKQTIQAYRDESREWREVAERAQAENAKLRELVDYMTPIALYAASEQERDRMRELAIGGEDGAQGPDDRA